MKNVIRSLAELNDSKLFAGVRISALSVSIVSAISTIISASVSFSDKFPAIVNSLDIFTIVTLTMTVSCIVITCQFHPSRLTTIAGVAIGFLTAMFIVEGAVRLNNYMDKRLDGNELTELVKPYPRPDAIARPSVTAVNTSVNECSASGNCAFIVSDTSVSRLDPPT